MTNKNNRKGKQPKAKTQTPFRDVGRIVGGKAASFFGIPGMRDVGKLVGTGIGRIFGSGDYKVVGALPTHNVLSGQIPKFSSTHATNIVTHREYIADITGTSAFTNTSYPLQPGNLQTFPWLNRIASSYSQYRIHGMMFEFRPLITDFVTGGAPGVVVMATNYNADEVAFTSKRQMENSEFAVSIKPTEQVMHLIECDPAQTSIQNLYVRTTTLPTGQDYKSCDLGNFQIATQGNPVQLLGELWVTYCIEFFKPELAVGSDLDSFTTRSFTGTTVADMGTVQLTNFGSATSTITATSATFTGLAATTRYQFTYLATNINSASSTLIPVFTTVIGTNSNALSDGSTALAQSTTNSVTGGTKITVVRTVFSNAAGVIQFTATAGTWGSSCSGTADMALTPLV